MISCPKCNHLAWKLADCVTNHSRYSNYEYSRYRHPANHHGKIKTCYVLKKKLHRLVGGECGSKCTHLLVDYPICSLTQK